MLESEAKITLLIVPNSIHWFLVVRSVIWHPKTKTEVSSFSDEVKDKLGYLIYWLQLGETLTLQHSRTMTSMAPGAKELRVKGKDGIYRTFYLKVDGEQILIFYAFKKKTQKTAQKDIGQGKKNRKRYRNG